jgi:hypothetical protein
MVAEQPVVVISADDNPAVAALNVLLGAVGTSGGIVLKNKSVAQRPVVSANGGTSRAVLIDASVPWEFVPQTNAEVFRFAAWDGGGNRADWLLPAPGFLEELTDIPTAPTSSVETYAIAASLLVPPAGVKSLAQFLAQTDPTLPDVEKTIHARCEELFRAKAGTIHGEQVLPVAKLESAQNLEEQLRKGAVWVGDPPRAGALRCALKEWPAGEPALHRGDWSAAWVQPVLPPLAAKLYQESDLREAPARRTA